MFTTEEDILKANLLSAMLDVVNPNKAIHHDMSRHHPASHCRLHMKNVESGMCADLRAIG